MITGSSEPDASAVAAAIRPAGGGTPVRMYGFSVVQVAACTLVAHAMHPWFHQSNVNMVYLLGAAVVAARGHRGPAVLSCFLSVAAFDFLFVEPRLTFAVADTQYLVTFAVMLVVALLISTLTLRLRERAEDSRDRELHTATLYSMSRDLAGTRGAQNLARAAVKHFRDAFAGQVVVLRRGEGDDLEVVAEDPVGFGFDSSERGVARWVLANGRPAGVGSTTLPGASALYLPLNGAHGTVGVVGLRQAAGAAPLEVEHLHVLDALANQTALALERAHLAELAEASRVQAEGERLRSTLLSSVSHDLRSPLAGIMGSASSQLEGPELDDETRRELTQSIYDEAHRLNRLVGNLLEMTQLQYGAVVVRREWQSLEEVVGASLDRLEPMLSGRQVVVQLPADMPLLPFDSVLIDQVLVNLLENAARYSPPATPIEIAATFNDASFTVSVADRGPGVPPGDEESLFRAFYRGEHRSEAGGVGLGLAICEGIVSAHGGIITAENRAGGGALFRFTIPRDGLMPVPATLPGGDMLPAGRAGDFPADAS